MAENKLPDRRLAAPLTPTNGAAWSPVANGPSYIGKIVTVTDPSRSSTASTFNFHFNPSTIQLSHSTDYNGDAAVLPATYTSDNKIDRSTSPTNSSVSFDLILDRMYEKWSNTMHSDGVWHDISVLYQVAGILPDGHTSSADITPLIPNFSWLLLNQGTGTWGMTYYGFISNLSVQYTHWSADMVPLRATASIGFMLLQGGYYSGGVNAQYYTNGTGITTPTAAGLAYAQGNLSATQLGNINKQNAIANR